MDILDNKDKLQQIDKQNMLETAFRLPELLQEEKDIAAKTAPPKKNKKINKIVISGMGGSGISGDVALDLLADRIKIPLILNKNFTVPAAVDKDSLFIAISYSGNTEETLSALKNAIALGATIAAVTSGGILKELAIKNKWSLFSLPAGYQPRAAFPFLCIALLTAIGRLTEMGGLLEEIDTAIKNISRLKQEYDINKPTRSNPIKQLAQKIQDKIPIIFAVNGNTSSAAMRMKTQLNENSKITAMVNYYPELSHNELVNLSLLKRMDHKFCLLLLRDEKDSEKVKKGLEIIKSLIGMQIGGIHEIWSQGVNKLGRLLSLIYFGDLLSVYVALLRNIDPTPVDVLLKMKKEMKR